MPSQGIIYGISAKFGHLTLDSLSIQHLGELDGPYILPKPGIQGDFPFG